VFVHYAGPFQREHSPPSEPPTFPPPPRTAHRPACHPRPLSACSPLPKPLV
jgi:hypothetical protein